MVGDCYSDAYYRLIRKSPCTGKILVSRSFRKGTWDSDEYLDRTGHLFPPIFFVISQAVRISVLAAIVIPASIVVTDEIVLGLNGKVHLAVNEIFLEGWGRDEFVLGAK